MADLTYPQLVKAVTDLAVHVTRGADAIRARADEIDEQARDTTRVAEMIASMRVDPATVAETTELAKITDGVSKAAIAYASTSDNTAKAANFAREEARASHAGIHEAVNRSPVAQIHDVDRQWFSQE